MKENGLTEIEKIMDVTSYLIVNRDMAKEDWIKHTDYYQHIGLYGFKKNILEKCGILKASALENTEKLEQLRALEDGMTIRLACVDTIPLGVDTQEDLEKARKILQA